MSHCFEGLPALYAIADDCTCNAHSLSLIDFSEAFFDGGGRILQLRIKNRSVAESVLLKVAEMGSKVGAKIFLNDYQKLAFRNNVGFHLGQQDGSAIKEGLCWGRSTHNLTEINNAVYEKPAAEYIGFGAVFESPTKPEVPSSFTTIDEVCKLWKKPIVFIGGITIENVHLLPHGDRFFYAVITDFFRFGNTKEDVTRYTKNFR